MKRIFGVVAVWVLAASCGDGQPPAEAELSITEARKSANVVGTCVSPAITIPLNGASWLLRKPSISGRTIAFNEGGPFGLRQDLAFYNIGPDGIPASADDSGPHYLPTAAPGFEYAMFDLHDEVFAAYLVVDLSTSTGTVSVLHAGPDQVLGNSDDIGPVVAGTNVSPSGLGIRAGILNWEDANTGLRTCDITVLPTSNNDSCWGGSSTQEAIAGATAMWVDQNDFARSVYGLDSTNSTLMVTTNGGPSSSLFSQSNRMITGIDVGYGVGALVTTGLTLGTNPIEDLFAVINGGPTYLLTSDSFTQQPTASQRAGISGEVWYAFTANSFVSAAVGIAYPQSVASVVVPLEASAQDVVVDGNYAVYRRNSDNTLAVTYCY